MTSSDEAIDNEITLYKTEQVAELCQVSSWTVRKWLNDGIIPGIKLDNQWRIRRSDLIKFLNERYGS